jgi:tRNA threonylcarbamoyladenosine biosynthesis protein TsaB
MLILTIRTDKPEAEIGLFNGTEKLAYESWQAHRQLAETIHTKINELLETNEKALSDLEGIVFYKGPGSFTGLRIGASVANALADSLQVPLISETDEQWLDLGLQRLVAGENDQIALPFYGSAPNITAQKK